SWPRLPARCSCATLFPYTTLFRSLIPEIDRTIVLVQSDSLVTVAVVYNTAVIAGWWLPLLTLALFIGGILLARRRSADEQGQRRSEEHTSELQSRENLLCRLLLEK